MAEIGVSVIGPGVAGLERTGDKLAARALAGSCGVPVLEAWEEAMEGMGEVRDFVERAGLPVFVKAVDGGGGRGIRLVRTMGELESAVGAARRESAEGRVFVERAAVGGWRHVEVQVLGDGEGGVRHLWERECSLQRRFQKVVEVAPATVGRGFVRGVAEAAVRMAEKVSYLMVSWELRW